MTRSQTVVRVAGILGGTTLGVCVLTVLAVWGVAAIVDLRGDVAHPEAA